MAAPSSTASSSASSTPALVPQGQHAGKPSLPMGRAFTLVGSRHRAHLHLLSRTVSKSHAVVINDAGCLYIRDTASREHVYVNDVAVQEAELNDGDLIRIGSFTFALIDGARKRGRVFPKRPHPAAVQATGRSLPLLFPGRTLLFGRRLTCDVVIEDEAVSAVHAIIYELDGQHHLRDLGSRTGTFVNGEQVHSQPLNFHDVIRIGDGEFTFVSTSATDSSLDELEHLIGTANLGEESAALARGDAARLAETAPEPAPRADAAFDRIPIDLPEAMPAETPQASPEQAPEPAWPTQEPIPVAQSTDEPASIPQVPEPVAPPASAEQSPPPLLPPLETRWPSADVTDEERWAAIHPGAAPVPPDLASLDADADLLAGGPGDTRSLTSPPLEPPPVPAISPRIVDDAFPPAPADEAYVADEPDLGLEFDPEQSGPAIESESAEAQAAAEDFPQEQPAGPDVLTAADETVHDSAWAASQWISPTEPSPGEDPLAHHEPLVVDESDASVLDLPLGTAVPPPFGGGVTPDEAAGALGLPLEEAGWEPPELSHDATGPQWVSPPSEIFDQVEPDPASAQHLEAQLSQVALEPSPDPASLPPDMSDSTFGRAVEAMTGSHLGSLVEEPAHFAEQSPATTAAPADAEQSLTASAAALGLDAPHATAAHSQESTAPVEPLDDLHDFFGQVDPLTPEPTGDEVVDSALAFLAHETPTGAGSGDLLDDLGLELEPPSPPAPHAAPVAEVESTLPPESSAHIVEAVAPAAATEVEAPSATTLDAAEWRELTAPGVTEAVEALAAPTESESPGEEAPTAEAQVPPAYPPAAELDDFFAPPIDAGTDADDASPDAPGADLFETNLQLTPPDLEELSQAFPAEPSPALASHAIDAPESPFAPPPDLEASSHAASAEASTAGLTPAPDAFTAPPDLDALADAFPLDASSAAQEPSLDALESPFTAPPELEEFSPETSADASDPAEAPSLDATESALAAPPDLHDLADEFGTEPSPAVEHPAIDAIESAFAAPPDVEAHAETTLPEDSWTAQPRSPDSTESAVAAAPPELDALADEFPAESASASQAPSTDAMTSAFGALETPADEPPLAADDLGLAFDEASPAADPHAWLEPVQAPSADVEPPPGEALDFEAYAVPAPVPEAHAAEATVEDEFAAEPPAADRAEDRAEDAWEQIDAPAGGSPDVDGADAAEHLATEPEEIAPQPLDDAGDTLFHAPPPTPDVEQALDEALLAELDDSPAFGVAANERAGLLDAGETAAAPARAASPPPAPAAPVAAPPAAAKPVDPLFGMSRDFGSFLGGMPLPLASGAAASGAGAAAAGVAGAGVAAAAAPPAFTPPPTFTPPPPPKRSLFADTPFIDLMKSPSPGAMPRLAPTPQMPLPTMAPPPPPPPVAPVAPQAPPTAPQPPVLAPPPPVAPPALLHAPAEVPTLPPPGAEAPPAAAPHPPAFAPAVDEFDALAPADEQAPLMEGEPAEFDAAPATDAAEAAALFDEPPAPPVQPPPAPPKPAAPQGEGSRPAARRPANTPPPPPAPAAAAVSPRRPPPAARPAPRRSPPAIGLPPDAPALPPVDVFSQLPLNGGPASAPPEIPPVGFIPPGAGSARRARPMGLRNVPPRPLANPPPPRSAAPRKPMVEPIEGVADELEATDEAALRAQAEQLLSQPEPTPEPPKKKKWKFPFFKLVALGIASGALGALAWVGLPPTAHVRTAVKFDLPREIDPAGRLAFSRELAQRIGQRRFRDLAQQAAGAELAARETPGFIFEATPADAIAYSAVVDTASLDADQFVLQRSASLDPSLDVQCLSAMQQATMTIAAEMAADAQQKRSAAQLAREQLAAAEQRIDQLQQQLSGAQRQQADLDLAMQKQRDLTDRVASLEQAASAALAHAQAIENDAKATAVSRDASGELARRTARLKEARAALAQAAGAGNQKDPAATLTDAANRLQRQADLQSPASAVDASDPFVAAVRQAGAAMVLAAGQITQSRQGTDLTVSDLRQSLAEKTAAAGDKAAAADPKLAQLQQDLAAQQHRLGAASGSGLSAAADKIQQAIDRLNSQIAARRSAVLANVAPTPEMAALQKSIDDAAAQQQKAQAQSLAQVAEATRPLEAQLNMLAAQVDTASPDAATLTSSADSAALQVARSMAAKATADLRDAKAALAEASRSASSLQDSGLKLAQTTRELNDLLVSRSELRAKVDRTPLPLVIRPLPGDQQPRTEVVARRDLRGKAILLDGIFTAILAGLFIAAWWRGKRESAIEPRQASYGSDEEDFGLRPALM